MLYVNQIEAIYCEKLGLKEGEDYIVLKHYENAEYKPIQPPHMNREQRRKAAKELRKKHKISNGEKVELDMDLKGTWGNKK